jgi:hypothetical protein
MRRSAGLGSSPRCVFRGHLSTGRQRRRQQRVRWPVAQTPAVGTAIYIPDTGTPYIDTGTPYI